MSPSPRQPGVVVQGTTRLQRRIAGTASTLQSQTGHSTDPGRRGWYVTKHPSPSARGRSRSTPMSTRLRRPWSPTIHRTSDSSSEDVEIGGRPLEQLLDSKDRRRQQKRLSAASPVLPPTGPTRRVSQRRDATRRPHAPTEVSAATAHRSSRSNTPQRDCSSWAATEVSTLATSLAPATRPPSNDHGCYPSVATEITRVPLQTVPPNLRSPPNRLGSEDPMSARSQPAAGLGSQKTQAKRRPSGQVP